MAAVEDGMYQPAMTARMDDLERQKAEILARMAEAPADVPDIHPNIAEIYQAEVVHLTEALADPEPHSEAADAVRSLVGEAVLTPGEKRGAMQAVLRGELMGILDFVAERRSHPRSRFRFDQGSAKLNPLAGPLFSASALPVGVGTASATRASCSSLGAPFR
jgi:site-specific DNA recombinase